MRATSKLLALLALCTFFMLWAQAARAAPSLDRGPLVALVLSNDG